MSHIASKILMVRPASFGFNPETAKSNAFQKQLDITDAEVQKRALVEFNSMAKSLSNLGIEVVVIEDTLKPHTPDSIFPNNWFSTHPDGTFCLYPMEAKARRLERHSSNREEFSQAIRKSTIVDLSYFEAENKFLEGTGSLILDHENRIAYACISSRTNEKVLDVWAEKLKFDVIRFGSFDEEGKAIYHTNVLMCLGDKFVVICLESITDEEEKETVIKSFEATGKEVVDISFEQMNHFAGNMLLLQNKASEKILVMSKNARNSLNEKQIITLESYAKLTAFDIETIETCGGGSVRCMIAEIFN